MAVIATSMRPSTRLAICAEELGAAESFTLTPSRAKKALSCATYTGQLEAPAKPMTRSSGICALTVTTHEVSTMHAARSIGL